MIYELVEYTPRFINKHFIFDYNSHISWSIFITLTPVETVINTPQSVI